MRTTKRERQAMLLNRLHDMGFSVEECRQLRRISMTLQRWFEMECGIDNAFGGTTAIERDDNGDGKPFVRIMYNDRNGHYHDVKSPTSDREAGARKRLATIMARHGNLLAYVQTDPRGCALYIVPKADLNGCPIDQAYTRGLAVCD